MPFGAARVCLVLEVGLEPTCCHQRRILNPVRLPIPPLQRLRLIKAPVAHLAALRQALRTLSFSGMCD